MQAVVDKFGNTLSDTSAQRAQQLTGSKAIVIDNIPIVGIQLSGSAVTQNDGTQPLTVVIQWLLHSSETVAGKTALGFLGGAIGALGTGAAAGGLTVIRPDYYHWF